MDSKPVYYIRIEGTLVFFQKIEEFEIGCKQGDARLREHEFLCNVQWEILVVRQFVSKIQMYNITDLLSLQPSSSYKVKLEVLAVLGGTGPESSANGK